MPTDATNKGGYSSGPSSGGGSDAPKPKLIGGFFWWFVLGICIIGDIFDIVLVAIQGIAGITGVGLPISAIVWFTDALFDFFLGTVIGGYYAFAGAAFGRMFILTSATYALEQVPILELLPILTLIFVLLRVLENMRRKHKTAGVAARTSLRRLWPA